MQMRRAATGARMEHLVVSLPAERFQSNLGSIWGWMLTILLLSLSAEPKRRPQHQNLCYALSSYVSRN
jgi:hypothetical protein